MSTGKWDDNAIQFPRLISELQGAFTTSVLDELSDSMDLPKSRIFELIERADWEKIKAGKFPSRLDSFKVGDTIELCEDSFGHEAGLT